VSSVANIARHRFIESSTWVSWKIFANFAVVFNVKFSRCSRQDSTPKGEIVLLRTMPKELRLRSTAQRSRSKESH
jgi:hypothetical protein